LRVPVVVSGADAGGVARQAARLRDVVVGSGLCVADVGWSSLVRRAQLPFRGLVLADDAAGLVAGLDDLASGEVDGSGDVFVGEARERRVGLLFAGQGSQRPGMGELLGERFASFSRCFEDVCGRFDGLLPLPLGEVVSGRVDGLNSTLYAQPALFAYEFAVASLLEEFGVKPDVVAGHSIGEITAACVAGVFSLEDACKLVAARGCLMDALPSGAMLSVRAGEQAVRCLIDREGHQVDVAAVNGSDVVVVAGDVGAVDALAETCEQEGVRRVSLPQSKVFRLMIRMYLLFHRLPVRLLFLVSLVATTGLSTSAARCVLVMRLIR